MSVWTPFVVSYYMYLLPVFSIVLHVELVENHLWEPRNIAVQRVKARLVRKDTVSPWSVGLWECWHLGCHVVVFTFHQKTNEEVNKHLTLTLNCIGHLRFRYLHLRTETPWCSDAQVYCRTMWHHCWVWLPAQQSKLMTKRQWYSNINDKGWI